MLQYLINGLCAGAVIAVISLGFGLIYNTTKVFHLAHGGVYVFTGYLLWFSLTSWRLSLPAGVILSLAVAALLGTFVWWVVYQPLARRGASSGVVVISSIGVQIVLENVIALFFTSNTQTLRASLWHAQKFGPISLTHIQIVQFVVGVAVTAAFGLFLKHTRAGQVCRAVSDDEVLSRVLGVRTARVHLLVFAVGSALAGVGSILAALDVGIEPYTGFNAVLAAAVACIIGGLRKFQAPALGGFLLGITQSLVVWQTSAQWKDSVTSALLILFLLTRRQGIFGVYRKAEEV